MATITGLTKLVWTGTSNSNSNVGCEDIQLTDYRNSISKLYVTDQSGSTFTFQRPSEADSGFAPVKEFKCGSAYLIFIKSDAINIPSATPSDLSKNSGLVQLNVPIQIKIQHASYQICSNRCTLPRIGAHRSLGVDLDAQALFLLSSLAMCGQAQKRFNFYPQIGPRGPNNITPHPWAPANIGSWIFRNL